MEKEENEPNKLLKVLKVLLYCFLWFVLFVVIYIFLFDKYDSKISEAMFLGVYIAILIFYYLNKKNYENWKNFAEYDKFHKLFCKRYKPSIIGNLIIFCVCVKFCNSIQLFVFSFLLPLILDTWDRRYITQDIKLDMILEKLNK